MPVIPLPPSSGRGTFNQQARSIPELRVRASPDAFGANVADVNYRGNLQLASNTASAAAAENRAITGALSGVMKLAGDVWQKDQRLEAEARLHDLSLGITRDMEGEEATGDGSHRTRTMATFEDRARDLVDNAQTPYQAGLYREGIQRLRFQHERQVVAAEVAAQRQARLDNINTIVEGGEVEIFRDPASLADVRARTIAAIEGANFSPSQRSRLLQQADRRLHAIAIERHLTSNNPAAARALLQQDTAVAALGGLEAARADARINRAVEEANERQQAAEFSRSLIEGTARVDPANAEHRRVINEAFTRTGGPQQIAARDLNAVSHVAGVARTYGMVPSSALSILQGMTANGTDEEQIFALQSVATIEAARPGVFENTPLHRTTRAEADDFRFMTTGVGGLGLDPAEALRRIQERRSPEFQARDDARRTAARANNGPNSRRTEAELVQLFDDAYFSDPAVGNPPDRDIMVQTYRRAFEHHYIRTGDEPMAIAAAQADVRRVYGVTRHSGPGARVVRRPVELVYQEIDGSHDWVRRQVADLIKAERNVTVAPEDIFLEATRETEQALSRGGVAGGHPPPYAFYWRSRDPRTGTERFETIPGRSPFTPNIAAARAAATERVEAERSQRVEAERPPSRTLGGRDVGRRPDPAIEQPVVPGLEPETLMGRDRERRERSRASVLDLFGWGARVINEGAR
jgi:hypothetical protein